MGEQLLQAGQLIFKISFAKIIRAFLSFTTSIQ